MNELIENAIEQYLAIDNPQYAIMLNGQWGTGKTHFISALKEKKALNLLHVRLFGLETVEDIKSALSKAMNKHLYTDNPAEKNALKSIFNELGNDLGDLKPGAGAALALFAVNKLHDRLEERVLNSDKLIICFDDIERYKGLSENWMGLVSHFLEERGLHVILLGDENRIKEDHKSDYLIQKEKIIRFTYPFQYSANERLNAALQCAGIEPAKDSQPYINYVLAEQKRERRELEELLDYWNIVNIRELSQSLVILKTLSQQYNQTLRDFPEKAWELAKSVIQAKACFDRFSNEKAREMFSKGILNTNMRVFAARSDNENTYQDVVDYCKQNFGINVSYLTEADEQDDLPLSLVEKAAIFNRRLLEINQYNETPLPVIMLIAHGIYQQAEFDALFNTWNHPTSIDLFLDMDHLLSLESTEAVRLVNVAYAEVIQSKALPLSRFQKFAIRYIWLSEQNLNPRHSKEDVVKSLYSLATDHYRKGVLSHSQPYSEFYQSSYTSELCLTFLKKLEELHFQHFSAYREREEALLWPTLAKEGTSQFRSMVERRVEKNLPLFVQCHQAPEVLLALGNQDLHWLVKQLTSRIKNMFHSNIYKNELMHIEPLITTLLEQEDMIKAYHFKKIAQILIYGSGTNAKIGELSREAYEARKAELEKEKNHNT